MDTLIMNLYFILEENIKEELIESLGSSTVKYESKSEKDGGWCSPAWAKIKCYGGTLEKACRYYKNSNPWGDKHLYVCEILPEEEIIHNNIKRVLKKQQNFKYLGLVKNCITLNV